MALSDIVSGKGNGSGVPLQTVQGQPSTAPAPRRAVASEGNNNGDTASDVDFSGNGNAASGNSVANPDAGAGSGEQSTVNADGNEASATSTDGGAATQTNPPQNGTPVTVNIPPDALRQITVMSSENRKLRKELDEHKTKMAEFEAKLKTPDDVQQKLARAAELEAAFADPKKWFALSKKTLEEVSEAYIAHSNDPQAQPDPRVDELANTVKTQQQWIEERRKKDEADSTAAQAARVAQLRDNGMKHVQTNYLETEVGKARWPRTSADATASKTILEAAEKVYARDFGETKDANGNVTRKAVQLNAEQQKKLFEDVIDRAEAMAEAAAIVEERRKNGGQVPNGHALSAGIELVDVGAAPVDPREGSGNRRPPTLGNDRGGGARSYVAPRPSGYMSVREAKAKALRKVGGGHE